MILRAARTAVAVAMVSLVFGSSPTPGRASSPGATLVGFHGDCLNSAESVPFIPGPSVYLSACTDVFLRYAPPVIGESRPLRVSNGSCLEADGVASTIGVLVSEQTCDGSPRQQWTATPTGEIVNLGSSLCLAPLGPDASTGSTIGTVVCDGSLLQRWRIRSHGRFRTLDLGDGAEVTAVAASSQDGHLWLGTNGGVF
ncbi:MAG: RICIN domain-containing protein, partial [Acidobacteriota bacterium]